MTPMEIKQQFDAMTRKMEVMAEEIQKKDEALNKKFRLLEHRYDLRIQNLEEKINNGVMDTMTKEEEERESKNAKEEVINTINNLHVSFTAVYAQTTMHTVMLD